MAYFSIWFGLLTFLAVHQISASADDDLLRVSQISPKSDVVAPPHNLNSPIIDSSTVLQRREYMDDDAAAAANSVSADSNNNNDADAKSESEIGKRIERSASPILNDERSSKSTFDDNSDKLEHFDTNDVEASDGRYFDYIRPTSTAIVKAPDVGQITRAERMGKDLSVDPFLSKRGPRTDFSAGSPAAAAALSSTSIQPTNVSPISPIATLANHPRQNPNPDIQDIITGIVKLLNGNVNVHANTQPQIQSSRRPYTSRINNRGPPRISEAQPLPNDFEQQLPPSTMRPPPYPFDRPDAPVRPFINGVPLPEQIVPSMQQNFNRPGFISQNRPPWQRPRPRPPITGNRRPIPPYQPIPSMPEYHPEDEVKLTTLEIDANSTLVEMNPTDPSFELGDYAVDSESGAPPIESTAVQVSMTGNTATTTKVKKEEFSKKKDKPKSSEKKPVIPVTPTVNLDVRPAVTTLVQSSSDIKTSQIIAPNDLVLSTTIESSIADISSSSSFTSEQTPSLSTSQEKSMPNTPDPIEPSTTHRPYTTAAQTQSVVDTSFPYHPRPGIVLDDPEFKPGGGRPVAGQQRPRPQVLPTMPVTPPGYGEIFDVTLSAIQGPSGSGSKQTIKIKPYDGGGAGGYGASGSGSGGDIIVSPSGDEGFVSIDGKRTYLNLFGDSSETEMASVASSTVQQPIVPTVVAPSSPIRATQQVIPPGVTGTGYAIVETEQPPKAVPIQQQQQPAHQRPHYRPRSTQPPVRIDTCIVGDDSTCDLAQNEKCKTETGVSSCHCRPGYSRRKHRDPCRRVVSLLMSLRVDKIYERRIVWDKLLADTNSEAYGQLSYEAIRAIDSAMSMTPFSDEFMDAKVNKIYNGDASQGAAGVFVNLTVQLEENGDTLRANVKQDIQKHLLGVIHRRNNNIGNSVLFVESPAGAVSNLQDVDECTSSELNDCHAEATCSNVWGSFRCECSFGLRDPWSDQPQRAGRECHACPEAYCNNRGSCTYDNGNQVCTCDGSYYGAQCEIDGEVLGVAIGASVTAVIIIVLTLICLVMWSRRWHREQKNAMGSPVFGYMAGGGQVKTPGVGPTPYQVTLEDRMRWAQIADVMAQSNHYGTDPVGSTRPSSAMFGYPNLQMLNTMGTMGNMSMAGTLPMHTGTLPPIPMPRHHGMGMHTRSNGMRTLENSSSSEEEDRTDLLGRHFQVPRPKSRSNGSVANQSGIYYDVDYAPSGMGLGGGGGNSDLYGGTQTTTASAPMPGPQGIPMSTYTAGRAPSSYYMK